jgi:hypothetical protein
MEKIMPVNSKEHWGTFIFTLVGMERKETEKLARYGRRLMPDMNQ